VQLTAKESQILSVILSYSFHKIYEAYFAFGDFLATQEEKLVLEIFRKLSQ